MLIEALQNCDLSITITHPSSLSIERREVSFIIIDKDVSDLSIFHTFGLIFVSINDYIGLIDPTP